MSSVIVVIDHDHAKIFTMSPQGTSTEKIERQQHLHHSAADTEKHKNAQKLYHEVAAKLKTATEILVLGHGTAKTQFKHHLEEHHHADIAKKVVGVENIDKGTDNEILALARKFFKAAHLFQ